MRSLHRLLRSIRRTLVPDLCCICGCSLGPNEEGLCLSCLSKLPYTHIHGQPGNSVECCFWGLIPIERAAAYIAYRQGGQSARLFSALKYHGRVELGQIMGRQMAKAMKHYGMFDGIDAIVPIPLAAERMRERGYNQAQLLAEGVSQETGLPVLTDAVRRVVSNPTQTRLNRAERWENVKGIFVADHPEQFRGKHVLLMDDIVTTGSTLVACAQALMGAGEIKFSVLTLGMGVSVSMMPYSPPDDEEGEYDMSYEPYIVREDPDQ